MQRLFRLFSGDALRARAFRSTALTMLKFGGENILRLGSNLILTRLLFPEAFGLMALVTVFLTGLKMFSDFGLNASIIRSARGDDPVFLQTAWTVQILRGVMLWLISVMLAGPVAAFYEEPLLAQLLPVAGLTAIIHGFGSFNAFTANRNLTLGRWTFLELGSQALGIIVMIVLAFVLQSVWALVIGALCGSLFKIVMSHLVLPGPRARIAFEKSAFLEIFHFGKWVFLSTIATFLLKHGDRAVLGKFIELSELAFYNIAFMLATLAHTLKTTLVNRVLYALYCKSMPIRDAAARNKVFRAQILLTGSAFLASTPFIVFGRDIVQLLYDPRYYDAGPMVVGIGFAWLFMIITSGHYSSLLAANRSRDFALLLVGSAAVRTVFMLFGAVHYAIPGVIVGGLLAELAVYPVLVAMIRPNGTWDWRHDVGFAVLAVLILALALWHTPDAWADFVALAQRS
jgi:O-antigen/teichoic acid export membrane protein